MELQERVSGFTPSKKIEYLEKTLSKKKMLAPSTRDAAYSLLGDAYNEIGKKRFIESKGERNTDLVEAAKAYVKAGKFFKAENMIDSVYNTEKKTLSYYPFTEFPKGAIGISGNSEEGQEIYNLVNKAKRNREKRGNLATRVSAFIFLLAGLFLMAIPDFSPTLTGNFLGASGNSADISFFIALALIILGGFLLFKSLKN